MSKQKESKQVRMDSWLFKLLLRDVKKNKKTTTTTTKKDKQTSTNKQSYKIEK